MTSGRNLAVVLMALLISAMTSAQDRCLNGTRVEGMVTNSTGAAIPNASVRVSSAQLTTSDGAGHFQILCAPLGAVAVTVQAQGFEPRSIDIQTHSGRSTLANIELSLAAVRQEVEVTADTGRPAQVQPCWAPFKSSSWQTIPMTSCVSCRFLGQNPVEAQHPPYFVWMDFRTGARFHPKARSHRSG